MTDKKPSAAPHFCIDANIVEAWDSAPINCKNHIDIHIIAQQERGELVYRISPFSLGRPNYYMYSAQQ